MHQRAKTFVERAEERYGFSPDVTEFPEGTKTAADAADAVGCDVGQIASSIVLDVDGRPVVVVTSGANRVDTEKVANRLDAERASMADADLVKKATGWSIGGVPPICHETDVRVLMDETLLDYDTVWAAAGTPSSVFPVDPERLRDLADAEVADVAE
ncbi:YbaK/EbsC family protein [Halospeciosus flavus]|uniref:YbaK/EbsC family protein n=1 Tax=Halospeciosus flavus TaxID=3032283 RepID=A0ABD5Z5R4_9EURY|nr:YbaK/EbsC family protein [Halospeciosus flavus]